MADSVKNQATQQVAAPTSFFPQWAQDVNTGISFLGFLLTLYVTFQVWSIRKQYTARGRLPDLLKDLQTKGSEINQIVVVWPTRQNEFAGELKICGEFLKAAEKLLGRSDASTVKEVQASIVAVNGKSLNAQEAWDLYGEVQRAIANLTQVSKDLNWK